jgi:diguanylate cyclase (GGDEF)-like protein/PAS domain S-box-containing protein
VVSASDFLDFLRDGDLLQLMLMACPDGVVVADMEDRVVLYSGASEYLFGFEPVEVLGKDIGMLFGSRENDRQFRERIRTEGSIANAEVTALRRGTGAFWAAVSASRMRDKYGSVIGTLYYVRDHSDFRSIQASLRESNDQLNKTVQQLDYYARHDGLTGLLNRTSAMASAEEALRHAAHEGKPFGVAIFDIDHFKNVNDTFGHLIGDEVLVGTAHAISQSARRYDIVGRFGGEEFVCFLPGAGLAAVLGFAERARAAVARLSLGVPGADPIRVTMSGGISCIPTDAMTLQEAVRIADDRLYLAKRNGRNRVAGIAPVVERDAA